MTEDWAKCVKCGFCRSCCPVFSVLMSEVDSPRGKAILMQKDFLDELFYNCTLCKACKFTCPLSLDIDVAEIRQKLVKNGITTEANEKMIKNIREFGNPFGKVEKGKKPKDLYCC